MNKFLFYFRFDQKKRIRNYSYFYRGIYKTPEDFDIRLKHSRSTKLTQIENLLKKFQYKHALISALNSRKNEVLISLLEELLQRGVFDMVVRKMNTSELILLMNFIAKHIIVGKFQETLIETLNKVLDEAKGKEVEFLDEIDRVLNEEIEIEKEIEEICGSLECIRNCQEF